MANNDVTNPGFKVNDRRGQEKAAECCRVCGGTDHVNDYNKPTMECIKKLRFELHIEKEHVVAARNELAELKERYR